MAKKVNEEAVEVIQEDLYQVASQNEINTVVAYIEKTYNMKTMAVVKENKFLIKDICK